MSAPASPESSPADDDEALDLSTVEIPLEPNARLRMALAAVAGLQLLLALALVMLQGSGWCPGGGGDAIWRCGTLLRPRLGSLGPINVSELAAVGSALGLSAAWDLLARGAERTLARFELAILGAGGALALAAQVLAWRAQAGLCPPCLLLAVLAALGAGLALALAARSEGGARVPLLAGLVALVVAVPLAAWRGGALAADDEARRAAALSTHGETGPALLLFQRQGCPFCQALVPDALGDPLVLRWLERTRGLTLVEPDDPRVETLGIVGVPTLVLVDASGRQIGQPLEMYRSPEEVARWLQAGLAH